MVTKRFSNEEVGVCCNGFLNIFKDLVGCLPTGFSVANAFLIKSFDFNRRLDFITMDKKLDDSSVLVIEINNKEKARFNNAYLIGTFGAAKIGQIKKEKQNEYLDCIKELNFTKISETDDEVLYYYPGTRTGGEILFIPKITTNSTVVFADDVKKKIMKGLTNPLEAEDMRLDFPKENMKTSSVPRAQIELEKKAIDPVKFEEVLISPVGEVITLESQENETLAAVMANVSYDNQTVTDLEDKDIKSNVSEEVVVDQVISPVGEVISLESQENETLAAVMVSVSYDNQTVIDLEDKDIKSNVSEEINFLNDADKKDLIIQSDQSSVWSDIFSMPKRAVLYGLNNVISFYKNYPIIATIGSVIAIFYTGSFVYKKYFKKAAVVVANHNNLNDQDNFDNDGGDQWDQVDDNPIPQAQQVGGNNLNNHAMQGQVQPQAQQQVFGNNLNNNAIQVLAQVQQQAWANNLNNNAIQQVVAGLGNNLQQPAINNLQEVRDIFIAHVRNPLAGPGYTGKGIGLITKIINQRFHALPGHLRVGDVVTRMNDLYDGIPNIDNFNNIIQLVMPPNHEGSLDFRDLPPVSRNTLVMHLGLAILPQSYSLLAYVFNGNGGAYGRFIIKLVLNQVLNENGVEAQESLPTDNNPDSGMLVSEKEREEFELSEKADLSSEDDRCVVGAAEVDVLDFLLDGEGQEVLAGNSTEVVLELG
jgi:hypothetical protein